MTKSILIVGAGVAGLAAAIALRRAGFDVQVFERRTALATEGAGIQLGPNATRVLHQLGIADAVAPAASAPRSILVHRGRDGRLLTTLPLGADIAARHGAPYWVLHRMDLVRALHTEALQTGATVRFDAEIAAVSADSTGVDLTFRDGQAVRGAAAIGADGVWSRVRTHVFGDVGTTPLDLVAARGIITSGADFLRRDAVSVWMAAGVHLVAYPVLGGHALNIVLIAPGQATAGRWSSEVASEDVRQRFSGRLAGHLSELVHLAAPWRQWPLNMPPPLAAFAQGRIAVVGDAAHPMLPFFAQGGAMALEDALALGSAMASLRHDPAAAFRLFSTLRSGRTLRVVTAARRNGHLYHLDGAPAMFRDAALRLLPGSVVMRGYDWLYGGVATLTGPA